MKKIAIITAGGRGNRMGTDLPKQFLLLKGKPLLWHTFTAFLNAYEDFNFVLVVPVDFINAATDLINDLKIAHVVSIVVGGETRFHSVKNGLANILPPVSKTRSCGSWGRSSSRIKAWGSVTPR